MSKWVTYTTGFQRHILLLGHTHHYQFSKVEVFVGLLKMIRTCLTGHTGSIHINLLRGRHTYTHMHTHTHTDRQTDRQTDTDTNTHTNLVNKSDLKKPGMYQPKARFKNN